MDYIRKKHWVKYHSDKCKMYLRNDFRFECAYCGMRESDNEIIGEQYFEKDHFVSKHSAVDWDVDRYDNMIYACRKCNGTKSDQKVNLVLDPCKDDIYSGPSPHIKKTGAENKYRLQATTDPGKLFIDSLQLNSRFYRKMREKQEQNNELRKQICSLLETDMPELPDELQKGLKQYLESSKCCDERSDEFRCGSSKGGEDLYTVLKKLQEKQIPYHLYFGDYDLDILLEFGGNTYHCEVRVNNYAGEQRRGPGIETDKKKVWLSTGNTCGILYYYKKTDVLELYVFEDEGRVEKYRI